MDIVRGVATFSNLNSVLSVKNFKVLIPKF